MAEMIAVCGLVCTDCPAYLATQDDDEKRKEVAQKWSSDEHPIKPEDINCDGCLAVGKRLIKFCDICEVRRCGFERKVETCGHCGDYPCEMINKHFEFIKSPEAKARLDKIKSSVQ